MRTSATCRNRSSAEGVSADARGFTLVEILVVLVVVGLLTGIAMPRLQRLVQSVEWSAQRKAIITELDGLGYRAFFEGKPLRLGDVAGGDGSGNPVGLPQGWQIKVARPIDYAYNGVCSGGRLALIAPDQVSQAFDLKAPLCRLETRQ